MQQCTHMMPSQRKISSVQGIDVELACDYGIAVCKAFELSSRQVEGRETIGYTKVDVQNYIRTRRQNELECGAAGWLMNYFQTQSWEDPSFFHAVQLDKDTMITNIFWADSKMISDYGYFGDVACVFGAAFIYDEMANSFAWLFNTFLNAMSRKVPRTILTDQDAAMAKALTELSESFNSGLKQYLSRQYALPDFFKHFDMLLYDKRYKEYEAEYDLVQKMPRMKARSPILDHARRVYTANIFELFQEQLLIACMSQYILNCNDNGNGEYVYEVALYNQKVIQPCALNSSQPSISFQVCY
ncbi:protein FAR1-RELATED SEQUENCE 5-like [Cornus florida]|uniref:protein FAR1-RELATED SEQUENCE 5-like n=1 Tax=Cornus florida TaxID=4283 RepID=UPI0028965DC5|nr:protein FAR1-RELATED SEQUENCE 5-like [Cornus florida]